LKVTFDSFAEEFKKGPALLLASRNCCPNSLAPISALFASSALSHSSMNGDKPDCLLGKIISWLNARCGDKGKEAFKMGHEPVAQVVRLARSRRQHDRVVDHGPANSPHRTAKASLGPVLVAIVERFEQFAQVCQQTLTVLAVLGVRVVREKLDVASLSQRTLSKLAGALYGDRPTGPHYRALQ
jgi:hypothetical protein